MEILYEHFIQMSKVIILGYQETKNKEDEHSLIIFLSTAILDLLFPYYCEFMQAHIYETTVQIPESS